MTQQLVGSQLSSHSNPLNRHHNVEVNKILTVPFCLRRLRRFWDPDA